MVYHDALYIRSLIVALPYFRCPRQSGMYSRAFRVGGGGGGGDNSNKQLKTTKYCML